MIDKTLRLHIVEVFRQDIRATMVCPNCEEGILQVKDIPFNNEKISMGGERYIGCPICDDYLVVLYRNPPDNWCEIPSSEHL